jgi:hypothetical protein
MQVHLQKKIEKKSLRRLFFHDSRYFSVFLNIASMSVSVVPIIAMSVSMSINRPTSKLWPSEKNKMGSFHVVGMDNFGPIFRGWVN